MENQINKPEEKKSGKAKIFIVLGIIICTIGAFIFRAINFSMHYEETDNAQVDGNIYPVLPRVSGMVSQIFVDENQKVKAGDIVVTIDQNDYQIKKDMAFASLENAKAAVIVSKANLGVIEATRNKLSKDLKRSTDLHNQNVIPQSEYDNVVASVAAAESQYQAGLSQIKVAEAQVELKKAELENAELQLSYTTIKSPVTGIVSKKNIEVGQFIQLGQPLMSVVDDSTVWVVANFKETQLTDMKIKQNVIIKVDAFPDYEFKGIVESISPATGSKFSLLPPDNASGNFVKVVQRIPVKILITNEKNETSNLRAGMNVSATVKVVD